MKWYEKWAEKAGCGVDAEMAECIDPGLEANKQAYGARFCPCKLSKTLENVCPCVEWREQLARKEAGTCHCGLFKYE